MKKVRIAVILLVGIFMVTIFSLFVTRVEASIGLPAGIIADKTEVCAGELVTFENAFDQGTHPYTKAEWDFDSDGIKDRTLTGTEAEVMADVTWAYDELGVYTVGLWMTDSSATIWYEERPYYITVGGCVTWTFPMGDCFPAYLPDCYFGEVVLSDLAPADIPDCVQEIEWFDPDTLEWKSWIPGVGGDLLILTAGNMYCVTTSAVCEWDLPLPMLWPTHIWTFVEAGFFPRHLPDTYTGDVVLDCLIDIPAQVQGVWWFDPSILYYRFWVPGVGGDLTILGGGHTYNYMVLVTGPCEWEIPLP